jgi:hypothetical protein
MTYLDGLYEFQGSRMRSIFRLHPALNRLRASVVTTQLFYNGIACSIFRLHPTLNRLRVPVVTTQVFYNGIAFAV